MTDVDTASAGLSDAFSTGQPAPDVPGLVVRHLRAPSDYVAMNRIANAMREVVGESFTTNDEQFQAYYETSSRFDRTRDVAVFEIDGEIVGYVRGGINQELSGLRVYEIMPFIDPAIDVATLYPFMLALMEEHLRGLAAADAPGEKALETFGGDSAPHLERLALDAGFVPVRYGYTMVRPTLDDLPDAPLPDGLEIRDVRPEDIRQIWDAAIEAFQDAWGETEATEDDYELYMADPVQSDSSLWRIAWDGDQVAGQVRSYIDATENEKYGRLRGYTEHISVGRPWRRRGLARALIVESIRLLKARGMTEAALGVDTENVSGALRVYESCGFVPVNRTAVYRKPID